MMKFIILFAVFFFKFIGVIYLYVSARPRLGAKPSGKLFERLLSSPQFDRKLHQFVNPNERTIQKVRAKMKGFDMTREFFFSKKKDLVPKIKLPEVFPDLKDFLSTQRNEFKFVWFGHSSFIVNAGGVNIMFDPVFSNSAAPFSFTTKRFQDPVVKLEQLPRVDYIVISHDHYDHLDADVIRFYQSKKTKFFVPLGVSSHLRNWGIEQSRISELDWWQSWKIRDLEFTCTPAQHFSGRVFPYENKTLWSSWVIRSGDKKFYYSGDSGYGNHFKQIGNSHGPFEFSFIENGQYDDQWGPVHLRPEETVKAHFDLNNRVLIPVHWGMFNMALHSWFDPIERISKLAKEHKIELLTPRIGEVISLKQKLKPKNWWKSLLPKKKLRK